MPWGVLVVHSTEGEARLLGVLNGVSNTHLLSKVLSLSWFYLVSDVLGCFTGATLPNKMTFGGCCHRCGCPEWLTFDSGMQF